MSQRSGLCEPGGTEDFRPAGIAGSWVLAAALFGICAAASFITYQPWVFRWDDSDYLQRSIAVSRGFWAGNAHSVVAGMVGIRPPVMTLLGLPWRHLDSWDDAGKCFITLAALTSLLVVLSLFLLLRIGIKPIFLIIASVCLLASLVPDPAGAVASLAQGGPGEDGSTRAVAVAFLADNLFAWIALATILLIPYEARTYCPSMKDAVVKGILWGSLFCIGAITKLTSLYFVVLVVPALFVIRLRQSGLAKAFAALITATFCSLPAAFYWLLWGREAWNNAKYSSFDPVADVFFTPLSQFLSNTIRESPGLVPSMVLAVAGILYVIVRKRPTLQGADLFALLVIASFGAVALSSSNREIRFILPLIVVLPFLAGILMSGKENSVCRGPAIRAAAVIFCGLVVLSVPIRHRPSRQSLARSDAVLGQTARCNGKSILLATDSPTLNADLMRLAVALSGTPIKVDTLAYSAMFAVPIEEDLQTIKESDEVVFQSNALLYPAFSNQRNTAYERYVRYAGFSSMKVTNDVSVYSIRCADPSASWVGLSRSRFFKSK